jgi:hypothetical protein
MNDLPAPTIDERKRKDKSSASVTSAGLGDIVACVEGEQLKQQYDCALQAWKMRSQPRVGPFLVGEAAARRAFQLRQEALTERNAAANRMYLHRAVCATCRRRR